MATTEDPFHVATTAPPETTTAVWNSEDPADQADLLMKRVVFGLTQYAYWVLVVFGGILVATLVLSVPFLVKVIDDMQAKSSLEEQIKVAKSTRKLRAADKNKGKGGKGGRGGKDKRGRKKDRKRSPKKRRA